MPGTRSIPRLNCTLNDIVRAELPGLKKEDVDISMTGDILTIKGERKVPTEVKEEEYHRLAARLD